MSFFQMHPINLFSLWSHNHPEKKLSWGANLPWMVLLPDADCCTKATKQKPTNPRLARKEACKYMLTFTVVKHHHFLDVRCARAHTRLCVWWIGLSLFPLSTRWQDTVRSFLLFAAYLSFKCEGSRIARQRGAEEGFSVIMFRARPMSI